MKRIVIYRCRQCGGPGKIFKASWVREFVLSCSGQLDPIHFLRPFEDGESGVCLVHCAENACQTLSGVPQALRYVRYARRLMEEISLNPERVKTICFQPDVDLASEINAFMEQIRRLDEYGQSTPAAPERETS